MIPSAETAAFEYVGCELDLFAKAVNWKRYWRSCIEPYVGGDVLEVGAGIGANTRILSDLPHRSWTCLEPDRTLVSRIEMGPGYCARLGTTCQLTPSDRFDSILYVDVLEHIEDDRAELDRAAAHLNPGGHVVVLAPAHQFLYTPFDRAVGHFRRYSRSMLRAAAPPRLHEVKVVYMDSVGMLASAANRFLLGQSMPNENQILTWDRLMVPLSRGLDPLLLNRVGKSVIGVWRRGGASG